MVELGATLDERLKKIQTLAEKLNRIICADAEDDIRFAELHRPLSELLVEEIDELQSSIVRHERASRSD